MNQGFADLGKMSTAAAAGAASNHMSSFSQSSFADEPPLLEELGIDFDHIRKTTIAVLNPTGMPVACDSVSRVVVPRPVCSLSPAS